MTARLRFRTLGSVALVLLVVTSGLVAGVGTVAAAPGFEYYDAGTQPAGTATAEAGGVYHHTVAVETDASSGPIALVVFYNETSGISYDSYTATFGGQSVQLETETSTVTVDGRTLTRVRFVHRSPSATGPTTLRVTANLQMPGASTTERVYSGGTHAPSGATLPRRTTAVNVTRPDLTTTALTSEQPVVDQGATVTATVSNVGPVRVSNAPVRLFVDGAIAASKSTTLAAGATTTMSFEWTPASTGSHTLEVEADPTDAVPEINESNNNYSRAFTVSSADSSGGTGPGGGSVGGGFAGSVSDPAEDASESTVVSLTASAETKTATGESATATVGTVPSDGTVAIDLATDITRPSTGNETTPNETVATVEGLNISVSDEVSGATVSVNTSATVPEDTAPLDASPSLGYVEVGLGGFSDAAVADGAFTFRVSEATRRDAGLAPDDVRLYRFHDGQWRKLETTHLGGERYQAVTPGFSAFAIGSTTANISVRSAELDRTTVSAGEQVSTTVTVANTGGTSGTTTLELAADGDVLATRTVKLAANGAGNVTLSAAPGPAGEYRITVGNETAGTLTVLDVTTDRRTTTAEPEAATGADATTATPTVQRTTTDGTVETTDASSTGTFGPGFGAPAAIVALLGVVLVLRRR